MESYNISIAGLLRLLEDLRVLSNKDYQKRVWVEANGPEMSTFTETVCGIYDDSGWSLYFDDEIAVPVWPNKHTKPFINPEIDNILKQLDKLIDKYCNTSLSDEEIINDPDWDKVRAVAKQAADLVEKEIERRKLSLE